MLDLDYFTFQENTKLGRLSPALGSSECLSELLAARGFYFGVLAHLCLEPQIAGGRCCSRCRCRRCYKGKTECYWPCNVQPIIQEFNSGAAYQLYSNHSSPSRMVPLKYCKGLFTGPHPELILDEHGVSLSLVTAGTGRLGMGVSGGTEVGGGDYQRQ